MESLTRTTTTGSAAIDNKEMAGGSCNEIALNSVNVGIDFGQDLQGLSLRFYAGGASYEIKINDEVKTFTDFSQIHDTHIGGVHVLVNPDPDFTRGELVLEGPIEHVEIAGDQDWPKFPFRIGGEELWLDEICPFM